MNRYCGMPAYQLCEDALVSRAQVLHDDVSQSRVGRNMAKELGESCKATSRSADPNDRYG